MSPPSGKSKPWASGCLDQELSNPATGHSVASLAPRGHPRAPSPSTEAARKRGEAAFSGVAPGTKGPLSK